MITTLFTLLLFMLGIAVGVVALLEPLTGLSSAIMRYLKKLLGGRLFPEIDVVSPSTLKKVSRSSRRRKSS